MHLFDGAMRKSTGLLGLTSIRPCCLIYVFGLVAALVPASATLAASQPPAVTIPSIATTTSLQTFVIKGTAVPGQVALFEDANGDGQPDEGEVLDRQETDGSGTYTFELALEPGAKLPSLRVVSVDANAGLSAAAVVPAITQGPAPTPASAWAASLRSADARAKQSLMTFAGDILVPSTTSLLFQPFAVQNVNVRQDATTGEDRYSITLDMSVPGLDQANLSGVHGMQELDRILSQEGACDPASADYCAHQFQSGGNTFPIEVFYGLAVQGSTAVAEHDVTRGYGPESWALAWHDATGDITYGIHVQGFGAGIRLVGGDNELDPANVVFAQQLAEFANTLRPVDLRDPPTSASVQAAAIVLDQHGMQIASDTSTFERYPLRVLIGITKGMADGLGTQAFFFYNDRYIATDTPQLSASVSVVDQTPDTVTLSYVLYRSGDAVCCPSLGSATVHYRWNGVGLDALDPVPSADFLVTPHR